MKAEDIKCGARYTDGKGNVREVVSFEPLPGFARCGWTGDPLTYKLVKKVGAGPFKVGSTQTMTRVRFARWAKEEVQP